MTDDTIKTMVRYIRDPKSKFPKAAREDIASSIEMLHQTLRDIEQHVFAKLPLEKSPPRNRLQVIAAKVVNAIGARDA